MKLKKIVSIIVLVFFISSISSVFANDNAKDDLSDTRWSNVSSIHTFVVETGSNLNACATILPSDADSKVSGRLYLQKYKNGYWSTVKSWKFSDTGFTNVDNYYNSSSGKYRTKLYVNVKGEKIIVYSSNTVVD